MVLQKVYLCRDFYYAMKTKELIYIILDLCKIASDDAYFTEEHV